MVGHNEGTPYSEQHLLDNFFQDGQGNYSITAQDMRDFVASSRYFQPLGWEFRFDSARTIGSPIALVDGVGQKVTFTNNPGEDLRYPSTFPEIWDGNPPAFGKTGDEKLDISGFENGFGLIRLSCLGSYTGGTVPHIDIHIDVGANPRLGGSIPGTGHPGTASDGSASNIIYNGSHAFAKGAGTTQAFNWIIPLFGGSDFVANGGQFIIESHEANASVWQFTLTAGAIMVPGPSGI